LFVLPRTSGIRESLLKAQRRARITVPNFDSQVAGIAFIPSPAQVTDLNNDSADVAQAVEEFSVITGDSRGIECEWRKQDRVAAFLIAATVDRAKVFSVVPSTAVIDAVVIAGHESNPAHFIRAGALR
jgi:hypothetical protein